MKKKPFLLAWVLEDRHHFSFYEPEIYHLGFKVKVKEIKLGQ